VVAADGAVVDDDICTCAKEVNRRSDSIQFISSHNNKERIGNPEGGRIVPHAQSATAFHFLISKRLLGLREEEDVPAAEEPSPAGAGGGGALMSVSMADIVVGR
jgi:hypothetical protein